MKQVQIGSQFCPNIDRQKKSLQGRLGLNDRWVGRVIHHEKRRLGLKRLLTGIENKT